MLTPNELRATDGLRDPEHRRQRDEWLAQYERAGIAPDEDPSVFELTLPVQANGLPDTDTLLDAAHAAFELRFATPDDVWSTSGARGGS